MTNAPRRNVAASVRARLLNLSKQQREDFNLTLTRYALERFLYRLGQSRLRERYVLKGAALFALWFDAPHRPTRDLDLLGAGRPDLHQIERAMRDYAAWLKALPGKPVFVAYPVAFDFMFVYWYLMRFADESPFSHSALDIKTLAMTLLKRPYRESGKRNMPAHWFDAGLPHTHQALDDAIEQGALFCNMLAELRGL